MKKIVFSTLLISFLSTSFLSCSKSEAVASSAETDNTILLGRWSLVNDSLSNTDDYYTSVGYVRIAGNYKGNPNDYYDFKADGKLHYFVSSYSGSVTYQILPDNKVSINNFQPGMDTASILNVTANSVTLYGDKTSANGGRLTKTINLKR